MCNCIYCHLRTRRKYLLHSEQQLASGGATSAPTRPPPPQLLRSIFQFSFSAPCSINHFLVLPGSASSASVVSCQSLRSGCPGSRNPRLAGKNARLCFETDFLVPESGTSCQLTGCVCDFFPPENPRQFTVPAYSCPFLARQEARGKSCSRFI